LSRQCSSIKGDGSRCRGVPIRGSEYCAAHHPDTQERRRRGAARGGKASKANPIREEIDQIRFLLRAASHDLFTPESEKSKYAWRNPLTGREMKPISRQSAAVLAQISNARLRLVETERKLAEQDEILARIENLERLADDHRRDRRFG
jgi:hypothetical protein